jgi:hypothetical protein
MLLYKWSTEKDINHISDMLQQSHKTLHNKSKLYIKKLLFFTVILLLEPKELDFISIRTNRKHYVRHTTILIGHLKTKGKITYYTGVSIFDILDRLFFTVLTLFGVWYVSNSVLSGILLSIVVYIILLFLSTDKDYEKLNSVKKIINWNTCEQ